MKDIDLTSIISLEQDDAQKWYALEKERDEVLKLQAKLFKLNYQSYSYSLSYESINFTSEKEALVTLFESHDVIFEGSAPEVSKMANLKHNITLRKTGKGWGIVNDNYNDDRLPSIKNFAEKEAAKSNIQNHFQATNKDLLSSSPLSVATLTTYTNHSYNRSGAVTYADHWWNARSVFYYNFSPNDCTNYVSQAMHDSTGAGIVYDTTGNLHWYYNGYSDYSTSWTVVQDFWYNMTHTDGSDATGPYGIEYSGVCSGVAAGDIIQINQYGSYDHAGIIVSVGSPCSDNTKTLLDAHDTDRYHYPISNWSSFPWRFIHIQGWYSAN